MLSNVDTIVLVMGLNLSPSSILWVSNHSKQARKALLPKDCALSRLWTYDLKPNLSCLNHYQLVTVTPNDSIPITRTLNSSFSKDRFQIKFDFRHWDICPVSPVGRTRGFNRCDWGSTFGVGMWNGYGLQVKQGRGDTGTHWNTSLKAQSYRRVPVSHVLRSETQKWRKKHFDAPPPTCHVPNAFTLKQCLPMGNQACRGDKL